MIRRSPISTPSARARNCAGPSAARSPSPIWRAASAGRCAPTKGGCRGGCCWKAVACRAPAPLIICLLRGFCALPGRRRSATSWNVRGRYTSASGGHIFSRRSIPTRAAAPPRSPRRSCLRHWRAAGAPATRAGAAPARRAPPRRPAANGLSRAFVDPALKLLRRNGAQVRFERRLRAFDFAGDRVAALEFEHDSIAIGPQDMVVRAAPAHIAATLTPNISTPLTFNAILNAHFNVAPPANTPPILGVVNAKVQWLFAYPDRLSVTVSDANAMMDLPREQLAADLWREVAGLTGLSDDLPSWRVIKERRATFAASPEEDARRPTAETKWSNLLLAGDYVQNGLPATIEGAIRSGQSAARLTMQRFGGA